MEQVPADAFPPPVGRQVAKEAWAQRRLRGWRDRAGWLVSGLCAFLLLTGLSILWLPFSLWNQHALLVHTAAGVLFLVPFALFMARHLREYWAVPLSHIKFSGWAAGLMTMVCAVSGLVLTGQGIFGTRITYLWRTVHIVTTFGVVLFLVPHLVAIVVRDRARGVEADEGLLLGAIKGHGRAAGATFLTGLLATLTLVVLLQPREFVNEFPADYDPGPYAEKGPFAPSLATTATGGAFDPASLADSASCGSAGCHEEIYKEWLPSAHRYAAMDTVFQAIQGVMAQQNGPISTRYCAGCHDPISLFQGSKDFGNHDLTGRSGYHEGISCLACHAIEATDVQGNANYVMHQPGRYVFEGKEGALAKGVGDFLIRTYPEQHVRTLSRKMFKTPEFCAACHKQFIDEEVNKVGWVQLQNQYDNWKASRWNHPDDPEQTLECRECHMPLVASSDPAAGDEGDFNRTADDGMHRSHRFLGANQFIPTLQKLEGGEEHAALVDAWLKGEFEVPEIAARWKPGPTVPIVLEAPEEVRAGDAIPLRVHLLNNKVGHDFPTGPLDIIQAWVEVVVTDEAGREVFRTGALDERRFIDEGTFMFKAEPVDRYGNLIDRHNLWEMVGVRFKRSLFPGAAEVARFEFPCPGGLGEKVQDLPVAQDIALPAAVAGSTLTVAAKLNYRKVDQYLINFAFGEDSGLSSPITTVSEARTTIRVAQDPGR